MVRRMSDPVPVIPLAYARPDAEPPALRGAWGRAVRVCHVLALLCCAVGWALLAFVDVETVVVSGPVLFVLGLVLIVAGGVTRSWRAVGFGAAHVGVCILFVALVNLRHWSPRQAEAPFTIMGSAYTSAAVFTALLWPRVVGRRREAGDGSSSPVGPAGAGRA
jgi:hypothetical protein